MTVIVVDRVARIFFLKSARFWPIFRKLAHFPAHLNNPKFQNPPIIKYISQEFFTRTQRLKPARFLPIFRNPPILRAPFCSKFAYIFLSSLFFIVKNILEYSNVNDEIIVAHNPPANFSLQVTVPENRQIGENLPDLATPYSVCW